MAKNPHADLLEGALIQVGMKQKEQKLEQKSLQNSK